MEPMTHEKLKAKALTRAEVRQAYEALASEFELLRRMVQARSQADMTNKKLQNK
jgi:hypothetical protein